MISHKDTILTAALAAAITLLPSTLAAGPVEDAEALLEAGDYSGARKVAESALVEADARSLPRLHAVIGTSLMQEGDLEGARESLEKAHKGGIPAATMLLGRIAFFDYDFPSAAKYYSTVRSTRKRSAALPDELDDYERELSLARRMLDHAERIVVLDSIAVDFDDFMSAYRLPVSAGRLLTPDKLPYEESRDLASMAFANEGEDYMMWSEPDSLGTLRLREASRLVGGNWGEPVVTPETLNLDGDADFPFVTADGSTLYYASDGTGSAGGYDIFIASRDPATGEYLEPRNIGMPFNSPADDYMMAIDESNGIGWWATDRNHIPGKLTVYVYELSDLRENIDPGDPELTALASLRDWRLTWPEDEESRAAVEQLRSRLAKIETGETRRRDFTLPVRGGRVYTTYDDFSSRAAATMMRQYVEQKERYEKLRAELAQARRLYDRTPDREATRRILRMEHDAERDATTLGKLLSDIYKAEFGD